MFQQLMNKNLLYRRPSDGCFWKHLSNRPKAYVLAQKQEILNTDISHYSERRIGKPLEHLRWSFFCKTI